MVCSARPLDNSLALRYGLQTANGTGALVQPILAWGQSYLDGINGYSIFHEVYDWNTGRDSRSPETYQVYPGDVLTQSVTYRAADNSYDMYISSNATGQSISWNYQLSAKQEVPETTAFIVVEHKPRSCDQYPASGSITFSNIYVEVDYEPVANPGWVAKQERPACDSEATVVDAYNLKISWDTAA